MQEVVRAIRNLRTEKRVPPSRKIPAVLAAGGSANGGMEKAALLESQRATIAFLAGLDLEQFAVSETLAEKPQNTVALTVLGIEIYLPLEGLVDVEAEKARLQKELDETDSQIERLEGLLGGSFAERAPANVVERERQKLATFKETAARLREQLQAYL